MKYLIACVLLATGCATVPAQASKRVVDTTLDMCLQVNAPQPGDTWKTWLKKKTWFECCIDSCDVACLPDDSQCLSTCQRSCWDGPHH